RRRQRRRDPGRAAAGNTIARDVLIGRDRAARILGPDLCRLGRGANDRHVTGLAHAEAVEPQPQPCQQRERHARPDRSRKPAPDFRQARRGALVDRPAPGRLAVSYRSHACAPSWGSARRRYRPLWELMVYISCIGATPRIARPAEITTLTAMTSAS